MKRLLNAPSRSLSLDLNQVSEEDLEEDVRQLHLVIAKCRQRNRRLRATALALTNEKIGKHVSLIEDYARYFRFGADTIIRPLQQQFLAAFIASDCRLAESVCTNGPVEVYEQWCKYKLLYPKMEVIKDSISAVDGDGDIVQAKLNCYLPITRASLLALYPAIVEDEAFVQSVLSKEIVVYSELIVYFNRQDKAQQIVVHTDLPGAWCRALENAELCAKMMHCCRVSEYGVVDTPTQSLLDIVEEENQRQELDESTDDTGCDDDDEFSSSSSEEEEK